MGKLCSQDKDRKTRQRRPAIAIGHSRKELGRMMDAWLKITERRRRRYVDSHSKSEGTRVPEAWQTWHLRVHMQDWTQFSLFRPEMSTLRGSEWLIQTASWIVSLGGYSSLPIACTCKLLSAG